MDVCVGEMFEEFCLDFIRNLSPNSQVLNTQAIEPFRDDDIVGEFKC